MIQTFIVMPEKDVTEMMIMCSLNKDDTYRKSLDGTLAVLKFDHAHPDCAAGLVKYTHTEILQYLVDNAIDWESPEI